MSRLSQPNSGWHLGPNCLGSVLGPTSVPDDSRISSGIANHNSKSQFPRGIILTWNPDNSTVSHNSHVSQVNLPVRASSLLTLRFRRRNSWVAVWLQLHLLWLLFVCFGECAPSQPRDKSFTVTLHYSVCPSKDSFPGCASSKGIFPINVGMVPIFNFHTVSFSNPFSLVCVLFVLFIIGSRF
jgi:hypothetical protein